jgi:hypothetical protein
MSKIINATERQIQVVRNLDDLRSALELRASDLAQHLLGEPNWELSSKRQLRFGTKGSLCLTLSGKEANSWYSHEQGAGGGLFDLIQYANHCDFKSALEFASSFVGDAPPPSPRSSPPRLKRTSSDDSEDRLRIAGWIWQQAIPITGTPAEVYLRARGIEMPLPRTLRYLPAQKKHVHSLVAAFGFADEVEPGMLHLDLLQVRGVHLIHLAPDGTDRLRDDAKVSKKAIGRCRGTPIVVAAGSDSANNLVIAEGIEDAMSAAQTTGFTAWASASASRLPALADALPTYMETVTIVADDDEAGQSKSIELAERLSRHGFEVRIVQPFGGEGAP